MDLQYGKRTMFFTWEGFDEMDETSGSGSADSTPTVRLRSSYPSTAPPPPSSKPSASDFFNSLLWASSSDRGAAADGKLLLVTLRGEREFVFKVFCCYYEFDLSPALIRAACNLQQFLIIQNNCFGLLGRGLPLVHYYDLRRELSQHFLQIKLYIFCSFYQDE